jgi:hypothetical protein
VPPARQSARRQRKRAAMRRNVCAIRVSVALESQKERVEAACRDASPLEAGRGGPVARIAVDGRRAS